MSEALPYECVSSLMKVGLGPRVMDSGWTLYNSWDVQ